MVVLFGSAAGGDPSPLDGIVKGNPLQAGANRGSRAGDTVEHPLVS